MTVSDETPGRGAASLAAGKTPIPAGDGRFAPPAVICERGSDGVVHLRSPYPLPETLELVTDRLDRVAQAAPERVCLAERGGYGRWRAATYRQVARDSRELAEELAGYEEQRPLAILDDASITHGTLKLAAMRAGMPFVSLPAHYLGFEGGLERLAAMVAIARPGVIATASKFKPALETLASSVGAWWMLLDVATRPGRHRCPVTHRVTPDDTAAIFFTSGSTGSSKGVAVTHRMVSANQAAVATLWPFLTRSPPVLLDWLPWNHTFGGNDNFFKAIWNGGSYYIDNGRPTPQSRFASTLANIEDVGPTIHINVPSGLTLLADALEEDAGLRQTFFSRLDAIFFAGAGIDGDTFVRLRRLVDEASAASGRRIGIVSGYGTTEAGSTICLVHGPIDRPGVIGLPLPGYDLRLVPHGDKLELRAKGPNVTPGYVGDADATARMRDADGYYATGDAVRFFDPEHPERGLMFDGRLAEDFKLSTGTWVSVGPLRAALTAACAPHVRDVVIAGEGQAQPAALLFLTDDALAGIPLRRERIEAAIVAGLRRHNAESRGSSTTIARAAIVSEPPSAEHGEVTDKGSLNQRRCLANRADLVAGLYAAEAPAGIIDLAASKDKG